MTAPVGPLIETEHVRIDRIVEVTMPMFGFAEFFSNYDPARHDVRTLGPEEYDVEAGRMVFSSCSYLIRVPSLTVLIDTGVGNDRDRLRPMFHQMKTSWLEDLNALVDLTQVDAVVPTHLHVDHVGWNTRLVDGEWVPTFPNARYLFSRLDVEELDSESVVRSRARNGDFVADSITPIFDHGLAEVIDLPLELSPEVLLEAAPGDTAGHLVARIRDCGRTVALVTGDAFHHRFQVSDPTLTSNFAALPTASIETRRRLFGESADDAVPLLACHLATHPHLLTRREGDSFRIAG